MKLKLYPIKIRLCPRFAEIELHSSYGRYKLDR